MDADRTFQKWLSWIDQIEKEVKRLCMARYVFESVRTMVNGNNDLDWSNCFLDHLRVWYAHSVLMAVRRQAKATQDKTSISLAKLLKEIRSNPQITSWQRYWSHFPDGEDMVALEIEREWFRAEWAAECGIYLDSRKIADDLRALEAKSKNIEHLADMRIAHLDKREVKIDVKLNDLNECVNCLESLVIKYKRLLRGVSCDSLLPEHMSEEWMEIFTFPWKEASANDDLEP